MTDRELLELAAKAAGIDYLPAETEKGRANELMYGFWLNIYGEVPDTVRRRWNPLQDDGDALRLAVKLGLSIRHIHNLTDGVMNPSHVIVGAQMGRVMRQVKVEEYLGTEPRTATRRAIVRAAAEIGRSE